MLATALGQLRAKDVEDAFRLCEKVRSRFDDEAVRVLCPYVDQPLIDERRLGRGFEAKGILVVVPVMLARRSQVDDGIVSAQLVVSATFQRYSTYHPGQASTPRHRRCRGRIRRLLGSRPPPPLRALAARRRSLVAPRAGRLRRLRAGIHRRTRYPPLRAGRERVRRSADERVPGRPSCRRRAPPSGRFECEHAVDDIRRTAPYRPHFCSSHRVRTGIPAPASSSRA